MPTFRNNTDIAITYESKGKLYSFPPHKDYPANFWLPYQGLGLELVNPDYPPVPDSIIISGTFRFDYQIERRFNIDHCEKYHLKLSVESGRVRLYKGHSKVGLELTGDYDAVLDWDRVPCIRIVGVDGTSMVKIEAEVIA